MISVRAFRIAAILLLVVAFIALLYGARPAPSAPRAAAQGAGAPMRGYAWSENVGWIDFTCLNRGTCATNSFGMSVAANGTISGYAWSENIGWVSANSADLTGCPIAPCTASMTTTTISGWFRAIAATGAQNGGWDGWIRLNGITHSAVTGAFAGYAWGSTNVGWVDFSYASTSFNTCTPTYTCNGNNVVYSDKSCVQTTVATCIAPAFCSPGVSVCVYPPPTPVAGPGTTGHLQVKPALVARGAKAKVYWNLDNVTSCTVTGTNGDSWSGDAAPTGGASSSPIQNRVDYTLSCLALDGAPYAESATVNVLPVFHER